MSGEVSVDIEMLERAAGSAGGKISQSVEKGAFFDAVRVVLGDGSVVSAEPMFAAGYETVSNTLAFAFHELGRRGDILDRLEREAAEVLGGGRCVRTIPAISSPLRRSSPRRCAATARPGSA